MNREHGDQISRALAAGSSRRGVLRALGVGGASGLLAVLGHEAMAGERPHQRLQDRTPKRNRKQRKNTNQNNKNQNNTNQNNQNNNQLGDLFSLGCSVAFYNQNSVTYRVTVIGEAGDSFQDFPTDSGIPTLSANDGPVTFVIHYAAWEKDLWVQAFNPDFGEPGVVFRENGTCADDCSTSTTLSEGEGFTIPWLNGKSFKVQRLPDSSDYKMFQVTALADA